MAPWYHALHPMPPREVDVMRPTAVVSVLGLDRVLTVIAAARPLLDSEIPFDSGDTPVEWEMTRHPAATDDRRVLKVVTRNG